MTFVIRWDERYKHTLEIPTTLPRPKIQQLSTKYLLDTTMITRKSKKATSFIHESPLNCQCWYTEYKYHLMSTKLLSFDKFGRQLTIPNSNFKKFITQS